MIKDISDSSTVEAIAFSEDGEIFVVGGFAKIVKIYQKDNNSL